ncbi:23S rRNA (adenine(2503)-C(2))-methyltransferase RlmN [Desulfofarcimen acetoxidans]|jgi:23S rRNA (adenine2503-C2)-methyltransferase|nr:23S rRNA (adenine(2503)-C(2))-methyltransferase RlmN [Desulfofarcimen acetoxidans]
MDLTLPQIENWVLQEAMPKFRARQIAEWMFQKGVDSFDQMTNLPLDLRKKLNQTAYLEDLQVIKKQVSAQTGTVKYLFKLKDGQAVETVLMRQVYGLSVCVSSQVGCRMSCRLCASTLSGLVRNLSAGEIYAQVMSVQKEQSSRISHVVIMGSGEPLDNFQHTLAFMTNINADYGLNIGYRHITLSTCGLVPEILALAEKKLPLTLAVSLHAPNNKLRDSIVPVNRKYPLQVLLKACKDYTKLTGRRVSFEYALIKGLNDTTVCAQELADLLKNFSCHINLIPVNPVPERGLQRTPVQNIQRFKDILEKEGLKVTVRREMGSDIDAACGQLRHSFVDRRKEVF